MSLPILATKLYVPPRRPNVVLRSRLLERLNTGLHRKLTLISAPAGFGKTTLVSEWVAGCERPAPGCRWTKGITTRTLSDLPRGCVADHRADSGTGVLGALQSPQPPPHNQSDRLLNDITTSRTRSSWSWTTTTCWKPQG
jgi:LuxR family maltose regulon positive regulatory protein